MLDEVFADAARAMADDALGMGGLALAAEQRQAGADAMRRIPHRRQAGPIARPTFHILLVRAAEKLDPTQFSFVVHLLDEKIFAAVNDGLHHHVDLADLALKLDDLPAFV